MATDIQDWTTSVVVQGGSVSITGIATVSISGTPTVAISGTPSVNIANTPAVTINSGSVTATISGTPNINIASSGVTLTVSISGTPAVSISGVPAVTINSGSVTATISGTPNINIASSGVTLNVSVSNTPAVTVSGTVSVSISAGSVGITGVANININSQSITVGVALPWTARGSKTTTGLGADSFTTSSVEAGAQTLGISMGGAGHVNGLTVTGVTSGTIYEASGVAEFTAGWTTVPINAALDSTYTIAWLGSTNGMVVSAFSSGLTAGYPALGQNYMGESVPVVIATDQSTLNVLAVGVGNGSPNVNLAPARFAVWASASRGVGTYTFDTVTWQNALGALLYFKLTAGAGTVAFSIQGGDLAGTGATSNLLTSGLNSGTAGGSVWVYPGVSVVANVTASQIVSQQVRFVAVVATAAVTFSANADIVP